MRVDIIGYARNKYVGKYQSCMVYNGRLIPHASYSELVARVRAAEEKHGDDDVDMLVAAAGLQVRLCPKCSTISVE